MSPFLKTAFDGYLMVDHRASPGIPEAQARRLGLDPATVKEGKVLEASTLGCPHCGAHVVLNPLRTRDRANCMKCNRYICDGCAAIMREPGYVHITAMQVAELVASGRYEFLGTMSRPVIQQKETSNV